MLLLPVSENQSQAAGSKGSGKRCKAVFTLFSEAAWGHQTCGFVDAAENLPQEHWECIAEKATTDDVVQLLDALSDDEEAS